MSYLMISGEAEFGRLDVRVRGGLMGRGIFQYSDALFHSFSSDETVAYVEIGGKLEDVCRETSPESVVDEIDEGVDLEMGDGSGSHDKAKSKGGFKRDRLFDGYHPSALMEQHSASPSAFAFPSSHQVAVTGLNMDVIPFTLPAQFSGQPAGNVGVSERMIFESPVPAPVAPPISDKERVDDELERIDRECDLEGRSRRPFSAFFEVVPKPATEVQAHDEHLAKLRQSAMVKLGRA